MQITYNNYNDIQVVYGHLMTLYVSLGKIITHRFNSAASEIVKDSKHFYKREGFFGKRALTFEEALDIVYDESSFFGILFETPNNNSLNEYINQATSFRKTRLAIFTLMNDIQSTLVSERSASGYTLSDSEVSSITRAESIVGNHYVKEEMENLPLFRVRA